MWVSLFLRVYVSFIIVSVVFSKSLSPGMLEQVALCGLKFEKWQHRTLVPHLGHVSAA